MTKPIFSVVISLLKILWLTIEKINFKNLFSTIRSRSRSWRKMACDYAGRHYSMSSRFFTLLRNRPKKNNLNQLYWYDFSLMGDSLSSFCDVCVEMEVLETWKWWFLKIENCACVKWFQLMWAHFLLNAVEMWNWKDMNAAAFISRS